MLKTHDYIQFELRDEKNQVIKEFSGSKYTNSCLSNDIVIWDDKNNKLQLIKRAKYPDLVGLIDLQDKTIYGFTSNKSPIYIFYPFDPSFPPFKVGCAEKDRSKNRIAIIRFLEWQPQSKLPRGSIQRILGPAGDFTVETQALIHLASPFYSNKIQLNIPDKSEESDKSDKTVKRQIIDHTWYTVNIDPPNCKDIDDVISLKQINDDLWHLVISIADVDELIQSNTINDDYAQTTTQTIYLNGNAARPMLPYQFSEGYCSLIPNQEKSAVSLFCKWIPSLSKLIIGDFQQTQLINKQSFTYESIYTCTQDEFPTDILRNIITAINLHAVSDSHKWIEELMILYNKEAAKIIQKKGYGILRAHNGYKRDILQQLHTNLSTNPELNTIVQKIALNSANYIPIQPNTNMNETQVTKEKYTHFMMSNELYCHATSPIRRYCDLFNQRILKGSIIPTNIEEITEHLNERTKIIKKVDRDILLLQQLQLEKPLQSGIPLWKNEKGYWKIWVSEWNRIITYKPGLSMTEEKPCIIEGSEVNFLIYFNPNRPNWKERLVIEII
jgi:exoribonuclease R